MLCPSLTSGQMTFQTRIGYALLLFMDIGHINFPVRLRYVLLSLAIKYMTSLAMLGYALLSLVSGQITFRAQGRFFHSVPGQRCR